MWYRMPRLSDVASNVRATVIGKGSSPGADTLRIGTRETSMRMRSSPGQRREHTFAQRRPAHDDFVVARIGLVVALLAAVEAAHREAAGSGDRFRCAGVPLLQAASVHVRVG